MRRFLSCVLCLLWSIALWGQEYLHRDFYGQGESRKQALNALMDQISTVVHFDTPKVLSTYEAAISRLCIEQNRSGETNLSLSGTALDGVFQARQNRASGILAEGRKAADPALRKVYYTWAWYYMSSLPAGHRLPGKDEVKLWLEEHKDTSPAALPVPMTHIEKEVATIKAVIGDYAPAKERPLQTPATPNMQEIEVVPELLVRDSLTLNPMASVLEHPSMPVSLDDSVARNQDYVLHADEPIPAGHYYVMLSGGFMPELSLGATVGYHKQWGALVSFHSNFKQSRSSYHAFSDGSADGGGYIWPEGSSNVDILCITAGGSYQFLPWLNGFITAGYGHRFIDWKDSGGQWGRIQDLSASGFSVSAGGLFEWNHLTGSIGISTIAFKTVGISVGIGYCFH